MRSLTAFFNLQCFLTFATCAVKHTHTQSLSDFDAQNPVMSSVLAFALCNITSGSREMLALHELRCWAAFKQESVLELYYHPRDYPTAHAKMHSIMIGCTWVYCMYDLCLYLCSMDVLCIKQFTA